MAFTNTSTALRQTGGLIVSRLAQGLTESNSDASGELKESIEFKVKATAKKIELDIIMLDYWGAVDEGRKAGKQPPIDKIKEWLTYPNVKSKLGSSDSLSSTDIAKTNSLAYMIARKIGREGTKGNNFATDVFDSKLLTQELPEAIANAVVEDADLILQELIDSFS